MIYIINRQSKTRQIVNLLFLFERNIESHLRAPQNKKMNNTTNTAQLYSTSDSEASFNIDEMFFSHTDRKGRILYGNDVFIRVSEYSEDELLNKPHNIIRHPDMPKTVFKLLWDTLLTTTPNQTTEHLSIENTIVAYVKNKSKSGKYYWVLALVFPFQDGFLSVRLKPTTVYFEKAQELYKQMLLLERGLNLDKASEKAGQFLMQELGKLGFVNYQSFMITALAEEIKNRQKLLPTAKNKIDQKTNDLISNLLSTAGSLETLQQTSARLETKANTLLEEFRELQFLCMNLTISAAKYEKRGAAISVTADTFDRWGREIKKIIDEFLSTLSLLKKSVHDTRIILNSAFLQTEMALIFSRSEQRSEEYETSLTQMANRNIEHTKQSITHLNDAFFAYFQSMQKLSESVLAMKIVRLNSRIETVYLPDNGSMIESTVQGVTTFIQALEANTTAISEETQIAKQTIENTLESSRYL